MSELIAIYRTADSLWLEACQWSKDNGVERRVSNEDCYKGINHRATMFYADDELIVSEYALKEIPRLTDDDLMDISDE